MIRFYSLSKVSDSDDLFARLANIDATMSAALAKMLNGEKYQLHIICAVHGKDGEVGLIYTSENIEFIITQVCCNAFREEIEQQLEKLRPGIKEFFSQ